MQTTLDQLVCRIQSAVFVVILLYASWCLFDVGFSRQLDGKIQAIEVVDQKHQVHHYPFEPDKQYTVRPGDIVSVQMAVDRYRGGSNSIERVLANQNRGIEEQSTY